MNDAIYIDTRENRGTPFSPPSGTDDYSAWLSARYMASSTRDGSQTIYFGVGQKINAIVQQHYEYQKQIVAFGPHAGAAAAFIEKIGGGRVRVDVLTVR